MTQVSCPKCGNQFEKTVAGSLTQFVLGKPLCNCQGKVGNSVKAKRDISYCYRCSKKIGDESMSSLTAFLQNRDYCRCRRSGALNRTGLFSSTTQLRTNKAAYAAIVEASLAKAKLQEELDSARTLAGTYRLVDRLGEGGMSYVYLAEHTRLRKMVALKVMKADGAMAEKEELFAAEARRLAGLNHPCLTAVFDFALHKDQWPVIAMELVSGETLADVLLRLGPLPLEEALTVFKKVAEGLSYIHLKGLVHKDLKPANVMLARFNIDGEDSGKTAVKILDFGIAQFRSYVGNAETSAGLGLIVGSPSYMSPEEWTGQPVTPRTDLYAFACSLYEVLTGSAPYVGESLEELKEQHLYAAYPGLVENKVNQAYPSELDLLLQKMLSKRPEERPRSAQEVSLALDSILAKLKGGAGTGLSFRRVQSTESALLRRLLIVLLLTSLSAAVLILRIVRRDPTHKPKTSLAAKTSTEISPAASTLSTAESAATGDKVEKLVLPGQLSLGTLTSKSGKVYELQGTVLLSTESEPGFSYSPSSAVLNDPKLLLSLEHLPLFSVRIASEIGAKQLVLPADFVEKLAGIKGLQKLDLWSVSIDRSAVKALCGLSGLKSLSMVECYFVDEIRNNWGLEMAKAKSLSSLEHLNLHYLLPADPVIDALAAAKSLQVLTLVDSPLSAGSFAKIVAMPNLTSLELNNCGVDSATSLTFLSIAKLQKLALGPECLIKAAFLDKALQKRNLVNLFVGPIDPAINGTRLRQYKTSFNDKQIFFRCEATSAAP